MLNTETLKKHEKDTGFGIVRLVHYFGFIQCYSYETLSKNCCKTRLCFDFSDDTMIWWSTDLHTGSKAATAVAVSSTSEGIPQDRHGDFGALGSEQKHGEELWTT